MNYKTGTGSWEPLFNIKGKQLYPELTAELDAMKVLRPTGGLMLRRDGDGRPWATKGEMLTHFARVVKKIIRAAGLRDEDVHVIRQARWWHRSARLRTDRRAVEAEGSVDDDDCYGTVFAPR